MAAKTGGRKRREQSTVKESPKKVKELTSGSELLAALKLDRVRGFTLVWEEFTPVSIIMQYYADPKSPSSRVFTSLFSGGEELLAALNIAATNIQGFTLRCYEDEPVTILVENYATVEKIAALTAADRLARGFSIRCDGVKPLIITNEMFITREHSAVLITFFDRWIQHISEE